MKCMQVAPGDRIFLYSDGLIEARNALGEQFGADEVCQLLNECGMEAPAKILKKFCKAIDVHTALDEWHHDDLTMIMMEVTDEKSRPACADLLPNAISKPWISQERTMVAC